MVDQRPVHRLRHAPFHRRAEQRGELVLENVTGDWTHPIHIHFEEHRILSRDFHGRYPLHCHNMVHEDHAMMGRWDIAADGDNKLLP